MGDGQRDPAARARSIARAETPLETIVISCQENRSFDPDFGYAPQVQAAGFGPPPGCSQPDADGNPHEPFEFTALQTADPPHDWFSVHDQFDGGAMDGFYKGSQAALGDGDAAIGYYTAAELPFYYSLLDDSALVANFFCSLLGPTWPNRFYFAAGTSGGITTNGVWGYGVFDYPIILDLLDAAGVSWGVYNLGWDSVRTATPTTSSCSGRSPRTTSARAAARDRSSTTRVAAGCRRCRG